MNGFDKRYFILISLTFLAFLSFALNNDPTVLWIVFVAILSALLVACRKFNTKQRNLKTVIFLLIISSVIGVGRAELVKLADNGIIEKYSGYHSVSGYVKEISSSYPYMSESIAHVESVDGEGSSFDVVLYTEFPSDMGVGDRFECFAQIVPLSDYENEHLLRNGDAEDYVLVCIGESEESLVINGSAEDIDSFFAGLNSKLSSTLRANLGSRNGSLASALLLGNKELLDNSTLRDFKRAGVYHMLALSGLHVAILIGILDFILKRLRVKLGIRIAVLSVFAIFYVALTDFKLSACRALVMLLIVYISNMVRRKNDSMTSLFAAVTVICLISPKAVFDLGLQLSFLSTLGVICAMTVNKRIAFLNGKGEGKRIKDVLLSIIRSTLKLCIPSVCVFILTLPLIMKYFGEVSLATFVSNLFMGVICEIFMVCSLLAMILAGIPVIGWSFAYLAGACGSIMNAMVSAIASFEGAMLSLQYPNTEYLVWGLFILSVLLFSIKLKQKWLVALPSIAFIILLSVNVFAYGMSREGSVSLEYLNNDTLVLSSADEVYIVDASNGRYGNLYEGVELAKENCFTDIDGVVLTHYHSYHATSLNRIVDTFSLKSVYLPEPAKDTETAVLHSIFLALEDSSTKLYIYDANEPLYLLGGELVISDRAYSAKYSHPSIALTYSYGNSRITLIENPYFDTYLESSGAFRDYVNESDVLIVGSDGRATDNKYKLFGSLKYGAEVVFASRETMLLSDIETFLDEFSIYVDTRYKKYDLK